MIDSKNGRQSQLLYADGVTWNSFVKNIGFTIGFLVLNSILLLLAIQNQSLFNVLMYEDRIGEWATFYSFALAGVIGLVHLIKRGRSKSTSQKVHQKTRRYTILALSFCCLFFAGEEISWGQRLFGAMPSDFFQELNHQQELNLHNILVYFISARFAFILICVGYGIVLPIAVLKANNRDESTAFSKLRAVSPSLALSPWFAVAAFVYWIDPVVLSLEAAELLLALLLFCDVILKCQTEGNRSAVNSRRMPIQLAVFGLPLILGAINNPVIDHTILAPDPARIEKANAELDEIAWDLKNAGRIYPEIPRQDQVFDSRIYNAINEEMVRFSKQSRFHGKRDDPELSPEDRKRRKYFLDPWNNPYWISLKGYGSVQVYSFGPNGRLDTILLHEERIPSEADIRGDDLSVWVDVFGSDR